MSLKVEIEEALLAGQSYEDFLLSHPNVKKSRWRDVKYFLKRRLSGTNSYIPGDSGYAVSPTSEAIRRLTAEKNEATRRLENITETLNGVKEEIRALPAFSISPPNFESTGKMRKTVILPLMDMHIGYLWRGIGGLGQYSGELFVSRCNTFIEDFMTEMEGVRASGDVEKLVLIFGGDTIDGRTIYPGQEAQSLPIHYQLAYGTEIVTNNLLVPLAKEFNSVEVFSLPGNHGRLGNKGQLDRVEDNLDLIFAHICKVRMEGVPHMRWHPMDSWYAYFSLYEKTYAVVHGDGSSWSGLSITGGNRYKERFQDTMKEFVDVLIMGHHHIGGSWTKGHGQVCMMNNWVGTSNYSSTFGLGGYPSQKVLVASECNPLHSVHEIMIARKEEFNRVKAVEL